MEKRKLIKTFFPDFFKIFFKLCIVFSPSQILKKIYFFLFRIFVPYIPSKKILFIQLDNVGDMICSTSIFKHYKEAFAGYEIVLLSHEGARGLCEEFFDRVIYINRKKAFFNFLYSIGILSMLNRENFFRIVYNSTNQLSLFEYFGIVSNIKAAEIFGYEGESIFSDKSKNTFYNRCVALLLPFYRRVFTRCIPSVENNGVRNGNYVTSIFEHLTVFYEEMSGRKESDYSTLIFPKSNLSVSGSYVVFGFGAAVAYRRWPENKFIETAKKVYEKGFDVVMVGSGSEEFLLAKRIEKEIPFVRNYVNKTSISDACALIKNSVLCVSNETSFAHIAVALKRKSVCVVGGGHLGRCSLYGYPNYNIWVFDESARCIGDNWMCGVGIEDNPSPCISNISVDKVYSSIENLLSGNSDILPDGKQFLWIKK